MSNLLQVKRAETLALDFFISQYLTDGDLLDEVVHCYDLAVDGELVIPTLGDVGYYIDTHFVPAMFYRAVYVGDISDGSDSDEYHRRAKEALDSGKETEFMHEMHDVVGNSGGIAYDDHDLGQAFINDVRKLLKELRFSFVDHVLTTDLLMEYMKESESDDEDLDYTELFPIVNQPILEVW